LSDLPAAWYSQAVQYIPIALNRQVQVLPGVVPGQLVVWGKPAEHEKVKVIVNQILAERPAATADTRVYTLQRSSNMQDFRMMLPLIAPNARPGLGTLTNPNQILVWAKDADHVKIKATVETLNESEPHIVLEMHPLRNVEYYSAIAAINSLRSRQGLDIWYDYESWGNRLIVLASPDNHKVVTDILDSLRAEERELLTVSLEVVDPIMAQNAVNALFSDEPYSVRPGTEVDLNTNTLFVKGIPSQLEQVRKMLREMGESIGQQPGGGRQGANIRSINITGGAEALKELERIWNQTQPNPIRIIKENETPPQHSLEDEITRENQTDEAQSDEKQIDAEQTDEAMPVELFPGAPPVYLVVNPDGSLTATSADTAALDQLESLLKRISSGVVFEGRDYTIYAVRNISANVVYQRLMIVLRDRLLRQQQAAAVRPAAGAAAQPAVRAAPMLIIQPDMVANTIYVQGTKMDRLEVGKLIAQFDVSELPGTAPFARKPISVRIENGELNRVYAEVMKVYQQKMMMTQLPGGVTPRIIPNAVSNTLEIFAPEPLATELKEYIEEVDRKALEEPGRTLHVIQLGVKAAVLQQAMDQTRMPYYFGTTTQMQPYGVQPYGVPVQQPYMQPMPVRQQQPAGGVRVPQQMF
jgi:hypothetical protein